MGETEEMGSGAVCVIGCKVKVEQKEGIIKKK
jgi:hypothetical protein